MPRRILFVGLVFCVAGLSAVNDVLKSCSESDLNLNFAVLLLPVGIGLFQGKARSRRWARFWIILGYFLCVLMFLALVVAPGSLSYEGFGFQLEGADARIPALIVLSLLSAFLILLHRLLFSPKASRFFSELSGTAETSGITAPGATSSRNP